MNEFPKVTLSICIPTLNRASFIGQTLESIVSQATDEVEVVIVDGGSTNATQEVVEEFKKRFLRIHYFRTEPKTATADSRSPSGAGFDRDCDLAVTLATGQYCWLFTDDDLLQPDAIQTVISATRQQYSLIAVDAEVRSSDLSECLQSSRLQLSADRIYGVAESQQLCADLANHFTFVGAVVVKRELWLARKKDPYIGTGFIHVGVLFQSPIPGKTLAIAKPLIIIRYGDAHYMRSSRFFEIWMFIWPNLIWSLPGFTDATKLKICLKEPWKRNKILLKFRAVGAFSMREYDLWLKKRLDSSWERLTTRLMATFPGYAANCILLGYHQLFKNLSGPYLLDLVKSPFYIGVLFRSLAPASDTANQSQALTITQHSSGTKEIRDSR